ncbi:MAG: hypothetical protein LIP23_01615 [Planctomycetes bacterium]|nr:hypothetical protein [Planctomycetota bacterium]
MSRFSAASALSVILAACAALTLPAQPVRGEDARARAERFDGLVESLNATSARRASITDQIYNELKGNDSREMHELLRVTLRRGNSLILQGVVEILAAHGDVRDVPNLETLLASSHSLEVKSLTLRLLPTFCLGSERDRFNYIRYAAGYTPLAPAAVLASLRRPPLTRRGRLDPDQDRLKIRIADILASQFDPVGAALPYIDDPVFAANARATIVYYTGEALGNDPSRWRDIWFNQSSAVVPEVAWEVEEIRMSALQSLADMGAEGTPNLLQALDKLRGDAEPVLSQALFDALGTMCRTAFAEAAEMSELVFDSADAAAGDAWRNRRLASAVSLALFSATLATEVMSQGGDPARFVAAADCLGASLSFPPSFPDPAGGLESARREGMLVLQRLLMMPELGWQRRSAVVTAMGRIGLEQSAVAIDSILQSPYVSAESGGDGLRLAESAVDSLALIAASGQPGRDAARQALLALLSDPREYPPIRPGGLPVGMAHLALWRLQRMARSTETALDADFWRSRLGW